AEQLRLCRAEQRAVFAVDDTIPVDVGDLVLARGTVGIPFTLLCRRQGAHVPLLPQASHLVAVDRPERLPHLDDEALVAVEEPAVARGPRTDVLLAAEVEHFVAVGGHVEAGVPRS